MNTIAATPSPRMKKYWNILENLLFLVFACTTLYITITSFINGTWQSFFGKGFAEDLSSPVLKKEYYQSVMALLSILTTFFLLAEMIRLFLHLNPLKDLRARLAAFRATLHGHSAAEKMSMIFRRIEAHPFRREFFRRYKSNFLSRMFNEYLSRLIIIFVYMQMMPFFSRFALFTIGSQWYWWIYAYLIWEFSYWVWHYAAHRVRIFWCLHAPHHAPEEMNLTVAWVHFFAEGYYTAAVQVPILMLMGVHPDMVAIILVIDGTWGTFIHAGEDAFGNGRLGILEKLVITPSHHRVHHAKNPLYIDTNFCVLIPFWDWLFGTLQNEKREVKIEYGITRPFRVTSFIDFYFGECICLVQDIRKTPRWGDKLRLLFMPPGWSPQGREKTAAVVRKQFLSGREELGRTSRDLLLDRLRKTKSMPVKSA